MIIRHVVQIDNRRNRETKQVDGRPLRLHDRLRCLYCRRLRADACLRAKPENNPNHSRRSISPLLNFLFERMKGGRVKKL